jgi:hypothetical protein
MVKSASGSTIPNAQISVKSLKGEQRGNGSAAVPAKSMITIDKGNRRKYLARWTAPSQFPQKRRVSVKCGERYADCLSWRRYHDQEMVQLYRLDR